MTNAILIANVKELIIRLQDAVKGYQEIAQGISNPILSKWMLNYASEREEFRIELENFCHQFGAYPDVRTSILGDLHRVFIDIKLNVVDENYDVIVAEIERGSHVLIQDYNQLISSYNLNPQLSHLLVSQRNIIKKELTNLLELKEKMSLEMA